jgi:hypothetical protein
MTIQSFIEKAIEGGWWPKPSHYAIEFVEGEPKETLTNYSAILLDPLAWKAVGKVEGWCEGTPCQPNGECSDCGFQGHQVEWLMRQHDMLDALADGKTIEQYLETL